MRVKIKALTLIWTGDIDRGCRGIKETGIIGSLRWWYEALVRGLGGYACDPTSKEKCELDQRRLQKAIREGKSIQEALDEQICPSCQLFGCTGWSRRFRLEVSGIHENDIEKGRTSTAGLKPNKIMYWNFYFFKNLSYEQKWLFKKTLWVIENYGAIGGRTTWKPNGEWGTDYGLIKVENYGKLKQWVASSNKTEVKSWLEENKEKLGKKNKSEWFNFKFYWIVKDEYLSRDQINRIVRRNPSDPRRYLSNATDFDRWLGGKIGESKKIFSFCNPKRVFGYVRNSNELEEIKKRLENELGTPLNFKTGEEILEGLE